MASIDPPVMPVDWREDGRVFLAVHDIHRCVTLDGIDVLFECIWARAQPELTRHLTTTTGHIFRTRDDLPFASVMEDVVAPARVVGEDHRDGGSAIPVAFAQQQDDGDATVVASRDVVSSGSMGGSGSTMGVVAASIIQTTTTRLPPIQRRRSSTQRSLNPDTAISRLTAMSTMTTRARSAGPRLSFGFGEGAGVVPMTSTMRLKTSLSAPTLGVHACKTDHSSFVAGRKRTLQDFGFSLVNVLSSGANSAGATGPRASAAASASVGVTSTIAASAASAASVASAAVLSSQRHVSSTRTRRDYDLPLNKYQNLFSCPHMTLHPVRSSSPSLSPPPPPPPSVIDAATAVTAADGIVLAHQRAMHDNPSGYGIDFEARALRLYNQVMQDQASLDSDEVSSSSSKQPQPPTSSSAPVHALESSMRYRRIVTLVQSSAVFSTQHSPVRESPPPPPPPRPFYLVVYMRGRMDAIAPTRDAVVEIKNRIHPLFQQERQHLWLREWLQVQSYMHLKDMPRAHLVECYWHTPCTADLRISEVLRDEKAWERIVDPALQAFSCVLYEVMFLISTNQQIAYLRMSFSDRLGWIQGKLREYRIRTTPCVNDPPDVKSVE